MVTAVLADLLVGYFLTMDSNVFRASAFLPVSIWQLAMVMSASGVRG